MINIRAIKIIIDTSDGKYGNFFEFKKGLNIIKGNNTSGKSSLFQSILYGLGFEELLGAKNSGAMQSIFNNMVEYPIGEKHNVFQSKILLEISNKNNNIITIERYVKSESINAKLIQVHYGALLTLNEKNVESNYMYIHDKGGASDLTYGFHSFLEKFIGWNLPEIINSKGDFQKIYIQQIAPSFVFEQKSGRSDFFANMPYYAGMSDVQNRVLEFLFNISKFEKQKKLKEIQSRKVKIGLEWSILFNDFKNISNIIGGEIYGLSDKPIIIDDDNTIKILVTYNNNKYDLSEYLNILKKHYNDLNQDNIVISKKIGEKINIYEDELKYNIEKLNDFSILYSKNLDEYNIDKQKLNDYKKLLNDVEDDLRKNKSAKKINSFGVQLKTKVSSNICPTCNHEIEDSLLEPNIEEIPMTIDDNIHFLDSKKNMIQTYISGLEEKLNNLGDVIKRYENETFNIRQKIRFLKKELTSDDRLPSTEDIRMKIELENKINFIGTQLNNYNLLIDKLRDISYNYKEILKEEKNEEYIIDKTEDYNKIRFLKDTFVSLLKTFSYTSHSYNDIEISEDSYLPILKDERILKIKNISSASDFIRCLWAYSISSLVVSRKYSGFHPGLIVYDEPKQQDLSIEDFNSFLKVLSKFKNEQILLFASFENSEEAFIKSTKDVDCNVIKIQNKLIKPI